MSHVCLAWLSHQHNTRLVCVPSVFVYVSCLCLTCVSVMAHGWIICLSHLCLKHLCVCLMYVLSIFVMFVSSTYYVSHLCLCVCASCLLSILLSWSWLMDVSWLLCFMCQICIMCITDVLWSVCFLPVSHLCLINLCMPDLCLVSYVSQSCVIIVSSFVSDMSCMYLRFLTLINAICISRVHLSFVS